MKNIKYKITLDLSFPKRFQNEGVLYTTMQNIIDFLQLTPFVKMISDYCDSHEFSSKAEAFVYFCNWFDSMPFYSGVNGKVFFTRVCSIERIVIE